VMLICHASNGRKWFKPARDIPSRWFPRDDLDAGSYAFDILYREEDRSRIVKIGADAWFDRSEASRYEIFEETIRVGAGEILTLLALNVTEMLEDWSRR
jgi:hypothetical protein